MKIKFPLSLSCHVSLALTLLLLSVLLTENATAQTYCASKGTAPWTEWIAGVQIGTINNTSVKEGYGNFTSLTTDLVKGTSYPLSITQGFSYAADPTNATQQGRAWIDFNKNGTFEDTEIVASFTRSTTTANVSIPSTASIGTTRMRISLKTNGVPTACEVYDKGEVEDYTVNITGGTALPDLTFSNIVAPTTARLNEVLNFSYHLKNSGTAPATYAFGMSHYALLIQNGEIVSTLSFLQTTHLNAGFDSLITFSKTVPFFVTAGNYTLRFQTDFNNNVVESNETNNIFDFPITLLPATTDNSKLRITAVTGPTLADPSTTLPLSITIKNEGTVGSAPDSVFYASWRRQFFGGGSYPINYALNRVAVPAIAAGATVTINANFVLPATLKTSILNPVLNIEPYIMLESKANRIFRGTPIFQDSFPKISFFYPIQPNSTTDLALTGSQLTTTWDSTNRYVQLSLTIRNNGTVAAKNTAVNVHTTSVVNSITTFSNSAIDSLTLLTGSGQISREFADNNSGREENGNMYFIWKVPELAAGASITATFRGKVVGIDGIPQFATSFYHDLAVHPYILYADVRDANHTNDSVPIFNYRFVPVVTNLPDLSLANLTVPTPSVQQGQILNFKVDGKNIGNAAATGNFTIKSYLSTDQFLDASDYQNGSIPTGNYAVGTNILQIAGAMTVNTTVPAGNYFLIVKIDADNVIAENNESNNVIVSTGFIRVTSPTQNLPDLLVNRALSSVVVQENDILLNYTFDNRGTVDGQNVNYSLIVSTDSLIGNDFYTNSIGFYATYQVGFVASNFIRFTVNPLFDLPAGNYYMIVVIDSENANVESDETNNKIAIPFTYQPSRGCVTKGIAPYEYWISNVQLNTLNNASGQFKTFASLGYSDYSTLSTTVNKGQSYPLSITPGLSWIGNLPNAYCRVWIDFNNNKVYEANELVLEKTNQNPLTQSVLIPTTAVTGAVNMRVSLKQGAYPTPCETFAKGEVEDYTVTISGGTVGNLPDLTLSNLTIPTPSVQQGQILSFKADFKNIGTGAAVGNFTVKSYLSTDNILSANDYQDGVVPTANYAAGFSVSQVPAAMTVNSTVPAGQYYLILKIDADNQIAESNENNNLIVSAGLVTVTTPVNNSCRFQDSLQLVSLYNATNGANWTRKWNLAQPITTWTGVLFNTNGCLIELTLNNNNLVGTLPSLSFSELHLLDLRGNPLTGAMPNLNCPKMLGLYLADNQFSGAIPNFNMPVLRVLMLYNNKLTGTIPNFNFPDLTSLHLDGNLLTGTIPSINFLNLTELYLNNNQFTGSIPSLNTPSLLVLALNTNKLIGSIPSNWNLPALNELYLSSNLLSGCIPLSLKSLCGKTVDISNNPSLATQDFTAFCSANNTGACTTGGGSDIALSITATPSVYRQFTTHNFKITAVNSGTTAFTNVKIKFTRPALTVSGGTKVASIGTFQDYCSGGIECSEWTIPTLAGGATATLDAPVFILAATAPLMATSTLLSSTPTDNSIANNTASVTVNPAVAPIAMPLIAYKPTQLIPIVIQKISPTIADNELDVELESLIDKTINFGIYNSMGQRVLLQELAIEKGVNKVAFDVSKLPQGLYFIQTNVGKGRNVPTKFVKM